MTTKIKMLVRSNKTADMKYHSAMVDGIPADEVCVLYLGGNGTIDTVWPKKKSAEEIANGDAKRIREEIVKPFFNDSMGIDIPVYAVAYDFDDYGGKDEINHNIHHYALEIGAKNLRHRFIKYIVPTIAENGKKISVDEIEHRIRFLKLFFTHDTDEFEFNKMLYDALLGLKYTDMEIDEIEKHFNYRKRHASNEHITDLFNRVILPRITTRDGKRRNLNDTLIEVRKITFVTHCYGALVVRKLQDEMRAKMPQLGFSQNEIKTVLAQMLVVAHAPSGRLDRQTESFYSFASAFDTEMLTPVNDVKTFVTRHRIADERIMIKGGLKDMEHTWIPHSDTSMRAMFLPRNMGNMFIIPRGFDFHIVDDFIGANKGEHENTSYVSQPAQNKYGRILNSIARNIVVNGINNSVMQYGIFVPLPKLEDLIQNQNYTPAQRENVLFLFKQMQKNGKKFLCNVYQDAMCLLRERKKPQPTNMNSGIKMG